MKPASLRAVWALVAPSVLLAGCSVFSGEQKTSLTQVDQLLSSIETVQVESTVSKERSRAALELLEKLVRPDFAGDATKTYNEFVAATEASEKQAQKLGECVEPMKESAEEVFAQWTKDLEAIGNTRLRAQSHVRMAETRARYDAVLNAAATAQVTYDAFNADLRDHALFLGHDFNNSAVAAIGAEVSALRDRSKDLDQRLDACDAAARRYVEAAALHGQLAQGQPAQPEGAAPPASNAQPAPAQPAPTKKPVATLPPRPDGQTSPADPSQSTPPKL